MPDPVRTKPLFELPEYERATKSFFSKSVHALTRAKSPLLQRIRWGSTTATARTETTLPSGEQFEFSPLEGASEFHLDWKAAVAGDLRTVLEAIDEASTQQAQQLVRQILEQISRLTEKTGQVTDAGGQPMNWDLLLDGLEKVEMGFDEQDQPTVEVVMHPDMAKTLGQPTREHLARLGEIIQRKRSEFDARRRSRRIS